MKENVMIAVGVILTALVIGIIKLAFSGSPAADQVQMQTLEQVAVEIAKNHNAAKMSDDMTISSTAEARGKQIVIKNVLRVKKGLSTAELKQFANELRREILPNACAQNENNPAFDQGLFYSFIYENTYGEKLAEIVVSKETCKWQ